MLSVSHHCPRTAPQSPALGCGCTARPQTQRLTRPGMAAVLGSYCAVPNPHTFSDLKQYKGILSVLEGRVRSHSPCAEVRVSAPAPFPHPPSREALEEGLGEPLFSRPFCLPALAAFLAFLGHCHRLLLHRNSTRLSSVGSFPLAFPLHGPSRWSLGPTGIPAEPPPQNPSSVAPQSLLPYEVLFSGCGVFGV